MENIASSVQSISNRINKLMALHQKALENNRQLQELNIKLTNEKQTLDTQFKEKESQINELVEKYKILKLAKTMGGSGDSEKSSELKLKINEIVREVDKCIALLND